ncbi:MAG: response regulator transcription factor [Alcaligenaceae bacterium]|nr:response regulator transcription factor [Alcaligenaceae bacterium]
MYIASLEDDPIQAQLIQQILNNGGHESRQFQTGKELLLALKKAEPFDLLLLDWELPDISGEDIVMWVRANLGHQIAIMFLTNRTQDEDLVRGLNAGADDYLTKPFKSSELLARINALLRRSHSNSSSEQAIITLGSYVLDPQSRLATLDGKHIQLAPKEFDLAYLFFRNIGRLFSRDAISAAIWNREIPATSRTLDTHLSNIRQKLQLNPENGIRIVSSYALGYRLELISNH